jgi:hypothetical protein
MYLIFDCSSIANPANYKAPFSDLANWPRLIHLSWILLNEDLKPMEDYDCIVADPSFTIDETIMTRCKLDEEDIKKKTINLEEILTKFNESVVKSTYVFSHNLNFNENILAAEFLRMTVNAEFLKKERFCLMQEGTYYCKIPSRTGGFKWPTLTELHASCFTKTYTPANNARADVIAATRCFIKLMREKAFEELFD